MKRIPLIGIGAVLIGMNNLYAVDTNSANHFNSWQTRCWTISGGGGGQNKKGNWALDVAFISDVRAKHRLGRIYGIGFASSSTKDGLPDYIDTKISHSDYRLTNYYNKGNELEWYIKLGWQFGSSGYYPYITGGWAWQERIQFAISNVTGWYFAQDKTSIDYFAGGVGILKKWRQWIANCGFSNRRGVNFGLGRVF